MASSSLGELAGHYISKLTIEYYQKLANAGFRDEEGEHKRWFIREILSNQRLGDALKASLEFAEKLQLHRIAALRRAGFEVLAIYFTLSGPGLVGTGSGPFRAVFEVGMSIDRVLGLPYYPESTVKGVSRAACETLVSEDLISDVCDSLYGSRGSVGLVVHGPVLPVGCRRDRGPCTVYWGDVVNPHHYRGGRIIEKEYEANPIPVVHLSIAPGTVFLGYLALRRGDKGAQLAIERLKGSDSVHAELKRYANGGPLLLAAAFTLSALVGGFAARSSKGYNIAEPSPSMSGAVNLDDIRHILSSVEKSIVRLRYEAPTQRGESRRPSPRDRRGPRRGKGTGRRRR